MKNATHIYMSIILTSRLIEQYCTMTANFILIRSKRKQKLALFKVMKFSIFLALSFASQ